MFGFGPQPRLTLQLDPPPSETYFDISPPSPPVIQSSTHSQTKTKQNKHRNNPQPQINDSSIVRLLPIYQSNDSITGNIKLELQGHGKKIDHLGIKLELVGVIEMYNDKKNNSVFLSKVLEIEKEGTVFDDKSYPFNFNDVELAYDSYTGLNVNVKYYVTLTLTRNYAGNLTKTSPFIVQSIGSEPEVNNTIKMEVGIEDCLHIEFEYSKSIYHLSDIIIGKIYFLLVRIKIKYMELAVIKRESCGAGTQLVNESETLVKYEIMDGAPVKGECIPVRIFLNGISGGGGSGGGGGLTTTFKNVDNKFSCKYYLNLVLVDEDDRRYFKQQEIVLWRKELGA